MTTAGGDIVVAGSGKGFCLGCLTGLMRLGPPWLRQSWRTVSASSGCEVRVPRRSTSRAGP